PPRWPRPRSRPSPRPVARPTAHAGTATPSACARGRSTRAASTGRRRRASATRTSERWRMPPKMAPMGTKVRPIRFQDVLLDEVEARLGPDGDLSHFVNAAVDRALHGDDARTLRLVPE